MIQMLSPFFAECFLPRLMQLLCNIHNKRSSLVPVQRSRAPSVIVVTNGPSYERVIITCQLLVTQ